jgi:conjugal transfer pilus assembly protein TraI
MALHAKRIDLVRQCANEMRAEDFQRKWLAVLERCAGWFSSAPLRPEQHAEPGGAFRGTVEIAFYAMRLAGGQKFAADLTSEKRRRLEPQYNYAVFLAAVCSWLDEPYRHFRFERQSDRLEWNAAAHGAFGQWLGADQYRVYRREAALPVERMRTAVLAQLVIGQDLLGPLDGSVLTDLFGAINPAPMPQGVESLVHKVVRQAVTTAEDFERKAVMAAFAPVKFDVPSAVHVALALEPVVQAPTIVPAPALTAGTAGGAGTDAPANSATAPINSQQAVLPFSVPEPEAPAAASEVVAGPAPVGLSPDQIVAGGRVPSRAEEDSGEFERVLAAAPNMLKDFVRALAQDVASGAAKVEWQGNNLALSKKLVGSYGIASDTLINMLRQKALLAKSQGNEIALVEAAGKLIAPK